jgi:hypothetical protein
MAAFLSLYTIPDYQRHQCGSNPTITATGGAVGVLGVYNKRQRHSNRCRIWTRQRVRPKSDRLAPKVLALVAQGRSYRLIGRELGLRKNTVAAIVKRHRVAGEANR